jgi:hypothetical protein
MVSLLVVIGLIGGTMIVIYAMVKIPMMISTMVKRRRGKEDHAAHV